MRHNGKFQFVRRFVALLAVGFASLLFYESAFARWGMPDGITDEARSIENLYIFTTAMAAVVFLIVEVALIYVLIKYRRRNDDLPPQTHGSTVLELIWTGIPVAIVIALFTYAFIVLNDVSDTANDEDMTVTVEGFQFQWRFTYDVNDLGPGSDTESEEQITIIGTPANEPELVIPANQRVEFALVSNDVIHSFYVPDFNYKLDIIPGRDNRFVVTARETGEFGGQCAELCGVDHALMRFKLVVMERDDFDQWVADQLGGDSAVRATE